MNNIIPTTYQTIGPIEVVWSKLKKLINELQGYLDSIPKELQDSATVNIEYNYDGEPELVIRYERPMTQGEIDAQKLEIERRERQEYDYYLKLKQKFEPQNT